ncbi:MAG TPA: hypothetical protein PLE85_01825 [Bacteroidales bacterium]|nr:hypothetical protein [Lentimicrobiaceae bacterium]HOH99254.1 hypothetical protein [Bacteroidales bacterium]
MRAHYAKRIGMGWTILAITLLLLTSMFYPSTDMNYKLLVKLLTLAILLGLFFLIFSRPKRYKELFDQARGNGMTTGFIALLVPLMMSGLTKYLVNGIYESIITINPLFLAWIGMFGFALGYLGSFLLNWKSLAQENRGKRIVLFEAALYSVALSVVIFYI